MARSDKDTSSTSGTSFTKCPFFKSHSKLTIVCEGVVPGTKSVMNFSDGNIKDVQKDIFCDGNFECCEMFRSIMRYKYIEEALDQ